jgi:probable phosphoglycerate mutase
MFRGRTELALTPRGVRQAELTGDHLRQHWDVDAIYCSPLGRCVRTAGMIGQPFALRAATLAGLTDIDYGAWSGLPVAEVQEQSPRQYGLWKSAPHTVRIPQGESLQEVAARSTDALATILAAHPQGTIAVVTHDSVIRVLLCHFSGLPLSSYWLFEPSPCGVNLVQASDRFTIRMVNGTQHLMDA